jgi:hypothetical protein
VEQQADLDIRGAEVVEYLPWGSFVEIVRRLDLHDQPVVDDHVDALLGKLLTLVRHANARFSSYSMTPRDKLALERHHVYLLEEAEA